jgi:hypothetical protein
MRPSRALGLLGLAVALAGMPLGADALGQVPGGAALPKVELKGPTVSVEEPAAEVPMAEAPKPPKVRVPEPPDVEAPKAPKIDAPKAPKIDAPKAPKVDAPKAPKVDAPKAPKVDAPKAPKVDAPKPPREPPRAPSGGPKVETPSRVESQRRPGQAPEADGRRESAGGPKAPASGSGSPAAEPPARGGSSSSPAAGARREARSSARRRATGAGRRSAGERVAPHRITIRRLRRILPRIRSCFDGLRADHRRLLSLRAGLGGRALSRSQTAEELGTSTRRVRRRERLALRELRTLARNGCPGAAGGAAAVSGAGPARGGEGPGPGGEAGDSGGAGFGATADLVGRLATPRDGDRSGAGVLGALAEGRDGFSRPAPVARGTTGENDSAAALAGNLGRAPLSLLGLLALGVLALGSWYLLARRRREDPSPGAGPAKSPPDPA